MSRPTKLTKSVLKRIINEERQKIIDQKKKIKNIKHSKDIKRLYELRKELKTLLQLKKEQKFLFERIKKIQKRTKVISKKIKE
jgi:hypothetical protein|tara:strand:+ start:780 stop:1028 length:249 start_codon:yes stop_codon:yes gene_type:complete